MIKFSKEKVLLLHQLMAEATGGSVGVRDGDPDYDFMESFGRKMMSNKYNQYLAYLAMSDTVS